MILSVAFALTLSGWGSVNPPALQPRISLPEASRQMEKLLRQELQRVRRSRALMEANIEMIDKYMRTYPEAISPATTTRFRRALEKLQQEVEELKEDERKLVAQQPSEITAPMPREVKPRNAEIRP